MLKYSAYYLCRVCGACSMSVNFPTVVYIQLNVRDVVPLTHVTSSNDSFWSQIFCFIVLIVGMGTKIQANTCLPQCYSVMDIDGNSSNYTKSVYQDDQLLRKQYHYLPMSEKSSNGYFKYDLEVARQTILKHESIFRNQV